MLAPGRVLVIDADDASSRALASVLQEQGFSVEIAHEAMVGFRMARENPPDCIVCTPELPDIDGAWVARRIRTEPGQIYKVPFLFVGTVADKTVRTQALSVGVDVFMARPPASDDEIAAQIKALIAMARRLDNERDVESATTMTAAFRGDLSAFPLASVLMMLEMERRSGTMLVVAESGKRAVLVITEGLFATTEVAGVSKSALAVLREVLAWRVGRFAFQTQDSSALPEPRASVGALVLEAMRLEDEEHETPRAPSFSEFDESLPIITEEILAVTDPDPPDPPLPPARISSLIPPSTRVPGASMPMPRPASGSTPPAARAPSAPMQVAARVSGGSIPAGARVPGGSIPAGARAPGGSMPMPAAARGIGSSTPAPPSTRAPGSVPVPPPPAFAEEALRAYESPSMAPAPAHVSPSFLPPQPPTVAPARSASFAPGRPPSHAPAPSSFAPAHADARLPVLAPTVAPGLAPTVAPGLAPTVVPALSPTVVPTLEPSFPPYEKAARPVYEEAALPVYEEDSLPVYEEDALPIYGKSSLPGYDERPLPPYEEPSLGAEAEPRLPIYADPPLPTYEEPAAAADDEPALPIYEEEDEASAAETNALPAYVDDGAPLPPEDDEPAPRSYHDPYEDDPYSDPDLPAPVVPRFESEPAPEPEPVFPDPPEKPLALPSFPEPLARTRAPSASEFEIDVEVEESEREIVAAAANGEHERESASLPSFPLPPETSPSLKSDPMLRSSPPRPEPVDNDAARVLPPRPPQRKPKAAP